MRVTQPVSRRSSPNSLQHSQRKFPPKRIIMPIAVVLIVAMLLAVWHFHKPADLNNVQVIVAQVSRHYQVPSNETPALATVTDSAKVQSSLAGKVKNNDKILIYENHQKAIVYRPSIDRIVDVETITVSKPSTTSGNSSSAAIPAINPFGN